MEMAQMPNSGSGMGFKDYLVVILDRKWIVLLIFLLVTAAAVYYAETTPPEYQGMAVLMSETNVMTRSVFPMMDPFYYRGPLEYLMNLERLMSTQDFADSVVKKMSDEYGMIVDIFEVRGFARLNNPENTQIIEVTARSGEPRKAAALTNSVAEVLIDKTSEIKNADTNRALTFLEEQMNLVDKNLREAEKKLNAFMEEEGIIGNTTATVDRSTFGARYGMERYQRSTLVGQLSELQGQLSFVKNEKELTKSQLDAINEMIAERKDKLSPDEMNSLVGNLTPQINQLQNRILDWQVELDALQETYTDKHYKVAELKQRIEDAQERLQEQIDDLIKEQNASTDPIAEWQGLLNQALQLTIKLKGYEEREKLAQQKVDRFKEDNPDLMEKEVELVRLEREARIREKTYMLLTDRYEEMRLLKQVNAQEFRIVDRAIPPEYPVKPNKVRIITLGLAVGLMLGLGIAFFLEYLDDSIKRMDDVERLLDLPIVGSIPKIEAADTRLALPQAHGESNHALLVGNTKSPRKLDKGYVKRLRALQGKLIKNIGAKSPVAESYRSLWTNIQFADLDKPIKTILVTSPSPKEGKSLTTANLALTMAQSEVKVLLIDADLRRPTIHRLFGCQRSPGLSELITSDLSNIEEYVKNTYAENLYILPGGEVPPNPVGILGSDKMKQLIEEAKKRFDIILFDSPPVVAMTDASVLATSLDLTLLVLHAGHTKRQVAAQAKDLMERLNINIFGVILNGVDYSKRYGYYYYYYHYHDYYSKDRDDDFS